MFLNENRIATRLMFGGNLIRQPAYAGKKYEVYKDLVNADYVMNNTFWIGVYPGLDDAMIQYIDEKFKQFFSSFI